MDLCELRTLIDDADRKLLGLLDERMQLALCAGRLKATVHDPGIEDEILTKFRGGAYRLLRGPFLEDLFDSVLGESRALQEQHPRLAGFQGERGAWSEQAVRCHDHALVAMPCRRFADVFQAVADGTMDLGVVPVENSIEGTVGEVHDLLATTALHIVSDVLLPIHHCLLVVPGTDFRDLKVAYSHPQALGQCSAYLSRHRLEPKPFYDTAGAARWLANERPPSAAVVASTLAAELYGLETAEAGIEDHADNTTRFVVLSADPGPQYGRKCSLTFSTRHRAGSLLNVLRVFAGEGLNLTRIESRPIRSESGAFAFLVDLIGEPDDQGVRRALDRLPALTLSRRVLGFYDPAPSDPGAEAAFSTPDTA